jgi:hypothetical protein
MDAAAAGCCDTDAALGGSGSGAAAGDEAAAATAGKQRKQKTSWLAKLLQGKSAAESDGAGGKRKQAKPGLSSGCDTPADQAAVPAGRSQGAAGSKHRLFGRRRTHEAGVAAGAGAQQAAADPWPAV